MSEAEEKIMDEIQIAFVHLESLLISFTRDMKIALYELRKEATPDDVNIELYKPSEWSYILSGRDYPQTKEVKK